MITPYLIIVKFSSCILDVFYFDDGPVAQNVCLNINWKISIHLEEKAILK